MNSQQELLFREINTKLQKELSEKAAELEAKNRELEIESALEKVRSASLAMQNSGQIREIVKVVFEKLKELKFAIDGGVFVGIMSNNSDYVNFWIGDDHAEYPNSFKIPNYDAPTITDVWNAKKSGVEFISKTYSFQEKNIWFEYAFNHTDFKNALPDDFKKWILEQEYLTQSFAMQKNSLIGVHFHHAKTLTENEIDILKRFSRVFEQSYVRFLDLQKAEAQAREAQIEAALEKVRSRSLAMHSTNELGEVVTVIVEKLTDLGVVLDANGVLLCTYFRDSKDVLHWIVSPDFSMAGSYLLPYFDHSIFNDAWQSKESGEEYFSKAYSIEEKNSFFEYAFEHSDYRHFPEEFKQWVFQNDKHILSFAWQKNSAILIPSHTGVVPSADDVAIFKRFAKVFEQTYTRFLDLQKAEAQAREAIKQASLDRVRGEIASMRTKDDLNRITPLIWKELNALGVPFIRCGVFIMNEEKRVIQTYLSTPDGHSLAAFEMSYDSKEFGSSLVLHWNNKEIYQDHWDKKQFVFFMQNLVETGQIKNAESFQGSSAPPESLDLHFLPFKQGMLYVGNNSPLAREELQLVQSLADSFSIAYARYEDFRQLEVAKNQIENTLAELKSTQSQLIQSEKMASLGELTAGIAHEIQNPLNFVNNFSEISNELLEEMNEELANGNMQLANEIAGDIKQNLEKINHHGKRADAIVKGMLQHSRASSGQKEPTDINALADEYLRLSYHGLRAKDKSFNADFTTDFAPKLPKINVIPQDIGRVLLNLINNAFYAVNEKVRQSVKDYKPMVVVSAKLLNTKVEIRVQDNGSGIPAEIMDKIFQPFFTTKPTGQGTGLGLSLSYDIVKAHSGELKVETKEGEGTEFIIRIPTN